MAFQFWRQRFCVFIVVVAMQQMRVERAGVPLEAYCRLRNACGLENGAQLSWDVVSRLYPHDSRRFGQCRADHRCARDVR